VAFPASFKERRASTLHRHSFLENTHLPESEAYAPIEQLIQNQLLNVLVAEKRTTCSFSVPTQTRLVQAKTLTTARSGCGFTTQIVPFLCLYY